MYCKHCGTELPNDAAFCAKCGTSQTGEKLTTTIKVKEARKETKVIQVHPDWEDAAIKEYEAFGWECTHSQTVKTKDSHLERGFGNSIMSVTETETFVKLTFQRNMNMDNYARIVELETQYKRADSLGSQPKQRKWPLILGILSIPIALSGIVQALDEPTLLVGAIVFLGIAVLSFWKFNKDGKKHDEALAAWEKAAEEAAAIKERCLEDARKLL